MFWAQWELNRSISTDEAALSTEPRLRSLNGITLIADTLAAELTVEAACVELIDTIRRLKAGRCRYCSGDSTTGG
jgi:hypothetical protein